MNLHHLAVFHAVANERSVSRGAERLRISQPAVSKQILELEESLGLRLLDRLPKGVRLTEAGVLLASYARRMFALEAEATTALADLQELKRGRLAVGASTTIGIYLLPEVFARFRQRHPGIDLHLEIGNTEDIQRQLAENSLDVGLTEGLAEADELDAEVFFMDELVAIVPADHPLLKARSVTAERLCREPFILREPGSGTRAVVERALAKKRLSIKPIMSLGSTEAIKKAVASGVGVAIVSRLAISLELEVKRLAIIPLADFHIARPLHLLRLRGKHETRAAKAFLLLLQEAIGPQTAPRPKNA
jgi:DNA-binding transcriptional LysR family regulator